MVDPLLKVALLLAIGVLGLVIMLTVAPTCQGSHNNFSLGHTLLLKGCK